MNKNIIRITIVAAGIAAAGLAGAGAASAQPYDGIADGAYSVSIDPVPGVQIPAGTATIRDGVLTYNGASGKITETPDADYASATATLPGYGKVALLPDGVSGRDVELVIGGSADTPTYLTILSLRAA